MVTAGYRPNGTERAYLAALHSMPGFQILLNIFESQIAQAQLDMINANPTDHADVLAKHSLAKAAAVFYKRSIDFMENELQTYRNAATANEIQPDVTEALFD